MIAPALAGLVIAVAGPSRPRPGRPAPGPPPRSAPSNSNRDYPNEFVLRLVSSMALPWRQAGRSAD